MQSEDYDKNDRVDPNVRVYKCYLLQQNIILALKQTERTG